jgi:hypothetical protein
MLVHYNQILQRRLKRDHLNDGVLNSVFWSTNITKALMRALTITISDQNCIAKGSLSYSLFYTKIISWIFMKSFMFFSWNNSPARNPSQLHEKLSPKNPSVSRK